MLTTTQFRNSVVPMPTTAKPGAVPTTEERLTALDARVASLEDELAARPRAARSPIDPRTSIPPGSEGVFWALTGLKERAPEPGAVLFTGAVSLPTAERWEWQRCHGLGELLETDWSQASETVAALGHPVRLAILREVLGGARTVGELAEHPALATSGQLYHHLRPLLTTGWLRAAARGRYEVPGERVVPLLTMIAAAQR